MVAANGGKVPADLKDCHPPIGRSAAIAVEEGFCFCCAALILKRRNARIHTPAEVHRRMQGHQDYSRRPVREPGCTWCGHDGDVSLLFDHKLMKSVGVD